MYAKCKEWDALAEHLATVLDIKKSSNVGGKLATKVTQKDIDTLPIANAPVRVSKYQKRVASYIDEIKELDLPREERMKKTKVANKLQKLIEHLDNDFAKAVAYAEKNFVIN
jgi:division protein CdvB (Snf7/Vps24/ESCRT-III family)